MTELIEKFTLAYRSPLSIFLDLMILVTGLTAAAAFIALFYMIGTTLLCLINIKAGAISSFIDPWVRSCIHTLVFLLSLAVIPGITTTALRYASQFRSVIRNAYGY